MSANPLVLNYVNDQRVIKALESIENHCTAVNKEFSDIVDAEGNQYIDLVMEGGGMLGIALVGYTYVLEKAKLRFLGIGGTSAGAINALMLAALGTPSESKSEQMLPVLANMPTASFIDGDGDARDFSDAVLKKAGMIKLLFKGMQVIDNLKEDFGLNPAITFTTWLEDTLSAAHIKTYADIDAKLRTTPVGLNTRQSIGRELKESDKAGRLAMIAADITTETKVEFPRMAGLYWQDPMKVNPACFARASMSVPFFFHPFQVSDCPQGKTADWVAAGYGGTPPKEVRFMDGGIMSNFPIDLFHAPYEVPLAPTFGVKIGLERQEPAKIKGPGQLLAAIFDTARHTLDNDFITRNPDYQQLVAMIDTADHKWLDFNMPDEAKVDLFARGAERAAEFLCKFDWHRYKETRVGIKNAFVAAIHTGSNDAKGRRQSQAR